MKEIKKILHFLKNENAAATIVEFAFVAPVFFVLLLGTIGWALTMASVNGIQFAAEQSARCANIESCGPDFNNPLKMNSDWISNLGSASFSQQTVLKTYLDTSGNPRTYKVICVRVQLFNNFIPDFAAIPGILIRSYCRPANTLS